MTDKKAVIKLINKSFEFEYVCVARHTHYPLYGLQANKSLGYTRV